MAEQKGIDIGDSAESEVSPLEEFDPNEEIEILSDENDEIESPEEVEIEAVEQEETDVSVEPAADIINEEDSLNEEVSVLDQNDEQEESADEEITVTENLGEDASDASDEQDEEEFDLDDYDDDDDGFLGLDDEELDGDPIDEHEDSSEEVAKDSPENDQLPEESAEIAGTEPHEEDNDDSKKDSKKTKKNRVGKSIKKPSLAQIAIAATLLVLVAAAGFIYTHPSIIGLTKVSASPPSSPLPETAQTVLPSPAVQIEPQLVGSPGPPRGQNEIYLAKIEEAERLKNELLAKNEEIYRLKLHYQNGIADLEEQIRREVQKEGITSYAQALKDKSIELNLKTIQRRRAYIEELEKPTQWIKQGSEELNYLKRKAQYDLQLIDIAEGIDMDKHMRHIAAAIQQYRPSAEKLAIDRKTSDLPSLETIWGQIKNQKKNNGQPRISAADKEISKEICAGNFERIGELTNMTVEAAQCLTKMNGSDLFLNNLTELPPAAAKSLFQWQGNWICINGVKKLSPAAAQHLFRWKGNWISLNGLTEFPPELATYLMEWEGSQLELMGLKYDKNNVDQKTLKYLALWETMGGKLFISDEVRQEIARVIM